MTSADETQPPAQSTLIAQPIEEELERSYLDYAMSVIVGRALPDVRDGLKPVHRRILYAMSDLAMRYNQPYKKCARIVGEVLGKYHPHGDASVYDALVRMGQDFSMRMPLVDGQGNFGSLDGDPPAAMRYTEARLARVADEMLQDLDKETVAMTENFDGSLKEPTVLPAKLPNLLVNGSSGIAVGMATNIPPHNLVEVAKAAIAYVKNPEIEVADLAKIMPGPDFPTGGIVRGRMGILQYYSSGRGRLRVRARLEREQKGNKQRLIIKEIPYMVSKADLVTEIAQGVKDKKLEGISDILDESDRDGMRVVLELKTGATVEVVENLLYHHTRCQSTFGVITVCIVDGRPRTLPLKEVLEQHVQHRRQIVRKRTQFDLTKALEKEHLLEGLVIALANIDAIVAFLKATKNTDAARSGLMEEYKLSEKQASAILEMRLARLTGLEQEKIRTDLAETRSLIASLREILASEQRILDIIVHELGELVNAYPSPRRTQIVEAEDEEVDMEDLIEPEDVVVTVSDDGYCKRVPLATYRAQRRGGKGIVAATTKEEDFVSHIFVANTHAWLLVFTDAGKVYWTKVYSVPEGSRQGKGKPIVNIVQLGAGERVRALIPVREFSDDKYLLFVTRSGLLKKTVLSAYGNVRQNGIIALNLEQGDALIDVLLTSGSDTVFIASRDGMAVRCSENDVRPMGRTSTGVIGIRLEQGDAVVDALISHENATILTVTEHGYGKRTEAQEYRHIARGGKGVINILTSERNGKVVAVKAVREGEDIMLISRSGITIRTPVADVRVIGRNTQGVRLMQLRADDAVVACAVVAQELPGEGA
jgi:DNA gyrase subunit A